ncbi:MAG: hypothetical protein HUU60_08585 [Armatimonadetes bacterium]|nr:hypothetical protein [Armatimonadota bacterium]
MKPLALIAAVSLFWTVAAQDAKPATSEVDALLVAIAEIHWFENVRHLKLTDVQLDKLMAANKKARERENEQFKAEAKDLLALKEDVEKARQQAIAGRPAPQGLLNRLKELEKKAAEDRKALRVKAVKELATELRPIFTDEQFAEMARKSKEVLKEQKFNVEGSEDVQLYWFYVEHVFLPELAVEMMKKLKDHN